MGWLNANGIWIGRNRGGGISWSSYCSLQSVQPATPEQVTLILKADIGSDIKLNWGDGSADITLTANGHEETHTSNYASAGTYDVSLSGELRYLREFKVVNDTTLSVNLDSFERTGLTHLELDTLTGTITGTINKFPSSLAYLRLDTIGSTVTGSINNLPAGLTLLDLIGHPLITGQLHNLSQYLIDLWIEDCPLVDGNINGFGDDMRSIYLSDLAQTISGTLENLPKKRINTLVLENLGTGISGDIECLDNTEKVYYGTIRHLVLAPTSSTDAFTGSFDTLITNNPAEWQTLKLINLGQYVTGKLDNMPLMQGSFYITGCGSFTYDGGALPAMNNGDIKIWAGIASAELDDFLIEAASKFGNGNYKLLDLAGNNEGHTSASDAAISTLWLAPHYYNVFLNDPAAVTNFDIDLSLNLSVPDVVIQMGFDRRYKAIGVDWGDGTISYVDNYHLDNDVDNLSHAFASTGIKNIKIKNAYGLSRLVTIATSPYNVTGLGGNLNDFALCPCIRSVNLSSSSTANMTGNLHSIKGDQLLQLRCSTLGANVYVDLDDIGANSPNLIDFYIFNMASGKVTGSIKSLPSGLTTLLLWLVGNAFDIATGPHPEWAGTTITITNNHSSSDVDDFLISWATTAGAGTKIITLTRSRTSDSDAAVTTLNGLGKTINTSG